MPLHLFRRSKSRGLVNRSPRAHSPTRSPLTFLRRTPRYHVSEGTLRCLSALPLRIREDERARAKARVKSKNRKRRREGSVEAGLMEADARVDEDVRAKCQADALHEVSCNRTARECCAELESASHRHVAVLLYSF